MGCALHIWHKHLFRKYCPLKILNAAVIRLLQIRRLMLRLSSDELNQRYTKLLKAVSKGRAQLCSSGCPSNDDGDASHEGDEASKGDSSEGLFTLAGGETVSQVEHSPPTRRDCRVPRARG